MKRTIIVLFLCLCATAALAQGCGPSNPNCIVPTAPPGTNNTQAASTQFVQQAISGGGVGTFAPGQVLGNGTGSTVAPTATQLSPIIDQSIGSTRGSILERGSGGWVTISPGTTALPWVSNGPGADPAYQTLTGAGIANNTVTNANRSNLAALSVPCNLTSSPAARTDCTTLPNPFSEGSSLYPSISGGTPPGFRYDANSNFLANTIGARQIMAGFPAVDNSATWVNTWIGGADARGATAIYGSSPQGTFGVIGATESVDNTQGSVQNIIATTCVVNHNHLTIGHNTWCMYGVGIMAAGAAPGHHINHELSLVNNLNSGVAEDPFNTTPTGSSVVMRLDSGNGGTASNNIGALLDLVNNNGKAISGIVFGSTALDTVLNAQPDAIALPPNYAFSWYNAAAAKTWQMYAGTGANGNLNVTTGGTGALAVTALSETTGQAYTAYTPTLSCGAGTLTTSSATGRSRQLGKTIFFEISATVTTVGTCTTTLIASLPFTAAAFNYTASGRENALTGAMVQGFIAASGSTIAMTGFDNSTGTTTSGGTGHATMLANGANFIISGTYERN